MDCIIFRTSAYLELIKIIIILNKYDLLQRKLSAGIRVADFLLDYADTENEAGAVVLCAPFLSPSLPYRAQQLYRSERKIRGYPTTEWSLAPQAPVLYYVGHGTYISDVYPCAHEIMDSLHLLNKFSPVRMWKPLLI